MESDGNPSGDIGWTNNQNNQTRAHIRLTNELLLAMIATGNRGKATYTCNAIHEYSSHQPTPAPFGINGQSDQCQAQAQTIET
jgi:hypothetical protein